jgi:hypothetical protein
VEIKGSELRNQIRHGNRDEKRHALTFMTNLIDLIARHHARILGRIYIKTLDTPLDGTAMYGYSIQTLGAAFQHFLVEHDATGLMILDSRNKQKNTNVSHGIFTQKFQSRGDAYDRLLDMPLFGHSDNHSVIQVADLLCSAFLYPMAAYVYCMGKITNSHVDYKYHFIRDSFGMALRMAQYRYQVQNGNWYGGITTSDMLGKQNSAILFAPPKKP